MRGLPGQFANQDLGTLPPTGREEPVSTSAHMAHADTRITCVPVIPDPTRLAQRAHDAQGKQAHLPHLGPRTHLRGRA